MVVGRLRRAADAIVSQNAETRETFMDERKIYRLMDEFLQEADEIDIRGKPKLFVGRFLSLAQREYDEQSVKIISDTKARQYETLRLRLLRKLVNACPDSLVFEKKAGVILFIPSNIPDTPWHTDVGYIIERDFQEELRFLFDSDGVWDIGIIYTDDIDEERLEQLRKMPYREYLQTPEWQKKRRRQLFLANYRCQVCNTSEGKLEVHHRTYARRGNELPSDLIVLCEKCHVLFHKERRLAKEG